MNLPVILSPAADREFEEAAAWYEQEAGLGRSNSTRRLYAGGLDNLVVQAAKPQEDGAEPRVLRGDPTSPSGRLSLHDLDNLVVQATRRGFLPSGRR